MIGIKGGIAAESFGDDTVTPGAIKAEMTRLVFDRQLTNSLATSLKIEYSSNGTPSIINTNVRLLSLTFQALNLLVFKEYGTDLKSYKYDSQEDADNLLSRLTGLKYGTKFALFTASDGFNNKFRFNDQTIGFLRDKCGSANIESFQTSTTDYIWYMVSKVGAPYSFSEYATSGECSFLYTQTKDTSLKRQKETNDSPIETDISVYSNALTGSSRIVVNGIVQIPTSNRGFIMCAINEVTGQVYYTRGYDISVCDPSQSAVDNMIRDILDLSIGTFVAITLAQPNIGAFSFDGLTEELKFALETVGASRLNEITSLSKSYSLIGRKGSRAGSAFDKLATSPSQLFSSFVPTQVKSFIDIEVTSNAFYSNNHQDYGYSSFKINGVYITEYEENNSIGLNVMIINPINGIIQELCNFNTQDNSDHAIAFAQKLSTLPIGTIVAVSAVGGASKRITGAIGAIEKFLGSKLIKDFVLPEPYCLIATVNDSLTPANQQIIGECVAGNDQEVSKSSCSTRFPLKSLFSNRSSGVNMCVRSKGKSNDASCQIIINGVDASPLGYSQGLNAIFVKSSDLSKTIKLYNTTASWEQFLLDVQSLDDGTFVLVAVKKSMPASSTTLAKKMVFTLIGASKFIVVPDDGSYSVIGIKGMAAGSALEEFSNGDSQVCVASWEPTTSSATTTTATNINNGKTHQTVFSVQLFDQYNHKCSPIPILDKTFASGNIYTNEPASNWNGDRESKRGRVVKALLIGLEYKKGATPPLDNSSIDINDHAAALSNCGYVLKENIHVLTENLTQVTNNGTAVCGPSANCIKDEISNWMAPNLIQCDSLYVAIIGRCFKKSIFGGNDPQSGLVSLDHTLTYSDYSLTWSTFLDLFNSVPYGVNITFVLDCNNSQDFLTTLAGKSFYQNTIVYLSSEPGKVVPLVTIGNSIGIIPQFTKILKLGGCKSTPLSYSSIITQLKQQQAKEYKSVPYMWIYGNSEGTFSFLTRASSSKVTIYQYHASVAGSNKFRYFYSRFNNVGGEWILDGPVWIALAPDTSDGFPIYQYSILTRPVTNSSVETYNYDYCLDSTHSSDPITGYKWYPMGSVWRAYPKRSSGLQPVYRYYFDQVTRRYMYSTNENIGLGWTLDGIAFYAYSL
ncbi:hypothetical protein DFA_07512 [Cavenderia fasciculata]|uniref:ILEI/PANDER domain-containing protein n=1 Tax=Cavenderia fasciculata TaxID=261658 RepID=F4PWM4_CACFS|nr:uncharacterized protein DFA_07512 [Cavenderia fasciculata]EGG20388.1 hypothetical protein DFA_07512 [Cavenderia fasciculata]|eukprot:XP_004367371.1 hypothetical protein DFA_07512 [Cavenderia fasciculata]